MKWVFAKAWRMKDQSTVYRNCTASKLDGILVNSNQLTHTFKYFLPFWCSKEASPLQGVITCNLYAAGFSLSSVL